MLGTTESPYDLLETTPDTDNQPISQNKNFLEAIRSVCTFKKFWKIDQNFQTKISFTTKSPLVDNMLCKTMPTLCEMIAKPSPFSPQEKESDLMKKPALPPTRMPSSTMTFRKTEKSTQITTTSTTKPSTREITLYPMMLVFGNTRFFSTENHTGSITVYQETAFFEFSYGMIHTCTAPDPDFQILNPETGPKPGKSRPFAEPCRIPYFVKNDTRYPIIDIFVQQKFF